MTPKVLLLDKASDNCLLIVASLEISADRNFSLPKVVGHGRKKLGQFGRLGLEIA